MWGPKGQQSQVGREVKGKETDFSFLCFTLGQGSRFRSKVGALNSVTLVSPGYQVPRGMITVLAHLIPTAALRVVFLAPFYRGRP